MYFVVAIFLCVVSVYISVCCFGVYFCMLFWCIFLYVVLVYVSVCCFRQGSTENQHKLNGLPT